MKKQQLSANKQKEIFYKLVPENREEIEKLHNCVNFENLVYHFKGSTKDIDINDFIDAEALFADIMFKRVRFEDVEKNQIEFNSKLISEKIGGNKSYEQLSEIENIRTFYNS